MTMKKFFAILSMCVIWGNLTADAQALVINEAMTRDKKVVTVSFDVDTKIGGLSGKKKEVLIPYIHNGADTLWLDTMAIYGKGRYMREKQTNHINGNKDWTLGENEVLKGKSFSYTATTFVKPWMMDANLCIRRYIIGCGSCDNLPSDECVLENVNLLKMPEYVLADATRNWDFGQDALEIIFKVSKIEIDSTVFDNEVTFGKILAAVDKIYANPNYKIEKIQVSGYASPEGRPEFNTWLGENRAKALIDYIIGQRPGYGLTEANFEIVNGKENWAGLHKILVASDMDRKDEVLAIIDDESISDEAKKLRIKAMDNGRIWKQMLDKIYPHLRSARYLAVYYDSTGDNAVEIINQANDMIRNGQYREAYRSVMSVSTDMRAYNTIGVSLMGQGRFVEALDWFRKAVESNCPSAQKNIDSIKEEYGFE